MSAFVLTKPDVGGARQVHDVTTPGMAPCLPFLRRILKHPRVMHYNRLVALVMTVNLGWAGYGATAANWWTSDGTDLSAVALAAHTNLAAAVVFRQQYVLNALAWLVTRPPTSWPLRVRWTLGKYYHFGGLHVGAALAGTLWYLTLVVSMVRDAVAGVGEASCAHMILGITIATTFTVMVVMALPRLRAAQHDRFEVTHRFCGWAALVLVWINTMLDVRRAALTAASSAASALDRRTTATGRPAVARLHSLSGQSYPLSGAASRIGRLADNDIVLDDAEVSRHHAVVSDTGTSFVITDLRSANGVYVQGRRIRGSVTLADRDRIRICHQEFVFEIESRD